VKVFTCITPESRNRPPLAVMGRRYGYPERVRLRKLRGVIRFLAVVLAFTLTAGCSYIQMQPKSGGQATPYAPRLP